MSKLICVIGLGKIGLPLAVQFARKGYRVRGLDTNIDVVDLVNSGEVPFPGEENLKDELRRLVGEGLLTAHLNRELVIGLSRVIIVVVPLYVGSDGNPEFSSIDNATRKIGKELSKGSLICFETTLPIGTTRSRFVPLLEAESGFVAGEDFYVAFSPERVYTGRVFRDLGRYPKIVGGINAISEEQAARFYESVIDFEPRPDLQLPNGVWRVGSPESAEFVKLAETTYRDVNIALANQFATLAFKMNLDIERIMTAANSQPFSHIHKPGIAVGGHCIPVYPHMYLQTDPDAEIVRVARKFNSEMPQLMVKRLIEQHGSLIGQVCCVLGVSYRGGVKESAFSGVHAIVKELTSNGAKVVVDDPLYKEQEIRDLGFNPVVNREEVKILVVQADHLEYETLSSRDFPNVIAILDGRGILNRNRWEVNCFISIMGVNEDTLSL